MTNPYIGLPIVVLLNSTSETNLVAEIINIVFHSNDEDVITEEHLETIQKVA